MTARLAGVERRVFVYERFDPSGASIDWLRDQGVEISEGYSVWDVEPHPFSERELITRARGNVGLMGGTGNRLTSEVMEALPELRYISKFGIGYDNIDVEAATRHGILVTNTPVRESYEAVPEHAIAMMLALLKRLTIWTPEYIRAGGWRNERAWSSTLQGKTVGIIGFGRIGRGVAKRLQGWEVSLLAYDLLAGEPAFDVRFTDLDKLLSESDVVTLHAAATPENRHLIDARALSKMKSSGILINTGRGSLVDLDALASALSRGQLAGAGIDVYEPEKPARDHPIFQLPNMVTTPHTAAWTLEMATAVGRRAAENMWQMLSGLLPRDLVNPAALESPRRSPRTSSSSRPRDG